MNRRNFFRGMLATTVVIPVSTKTIIDMAANTWRRPVPGDFYEVTRELPMWVKWAAATQAGVIIGGVAMRSYDLLFASVKP